MTFDERAREHLDQIWANRDRMSIEEFNAEAAAANANALLAVKLPLEDLVEQLRIANLIALAKIAGDTDKYHEGLCEAAYGALDALTHTKSVPNGHMDPHEIEVLRPEIAAALKIKEGNYS